MVRRLSWSSRRCVLHIIIFCPAITNTHAGTIVATLLTPIGSYFDKSHQASYLGTSYLLSVCCFTPLYGKSMLVLAHGVAYLPLQDACLISLVANMPCSYPFSSRSAKHTQSIKASGSRPLWSWNCFMCHSTDNGIFDRRPCDCWYGWWRVCLHP